MYCWISVVALTAAPCVALVLAAWHRVRALRRVLVVERRVLAAERTEHRLTDAANYRDLCALRARLREARSAAPVLAAADQELDRALALHALNRDPEEGDHP